MSNENKYTVKQHIGFIKRGLNILSKHPQAQRWLIYATA